MSIPPGNAGSFSRTPENAPNDKADILARTVAAITAGEIDQARLILRAEYPFTPVTKAARRYTERQSLRIFYRDGFLDRYSGAQLVHPGALRTLSLIAPEEFPFDPHWATSQSHFAFWELFPTIDHLMPVARGGADEAANWVSTSMLHNSAKAHWTLDELGWTLAPPGDHTRWDGLAGWFVDHLRAHRELLADTYLARWLRATVDVRAELPGTSGQAGVLD
ncbi:hypothetical protein TN91_21570 [Rhodococcus ruber]|nr:HNH endonuclease [Rhodococcus ruber]RQM32255.1 hypothetical protein TN91_21570 [Rhodococcus ruber]